MSLTLSTATTQPPVIPTAPPSTAQSVFSDASASSEAPLTLETLTAVVLDIQREMREMRVAWAGLV